jgi:hypothetical protein
MNMKRAGHAANLGEIRKTCKIFLRKPEAFVKFGRCGVQNCTTLSGVLNRLTKGKCHGLIWHTIRNRSEKKWPNIGFYSGQSISPSPNLTSVPEGICSSELVPESLLNISALYSKKNKLKEKHWYIDPHEKTTSWRLRNWNIAEEEFNQI